MPATTTARARRPGVPVPVYAATRDASWYNRPDTRKIKVFHIATEDDTAACAPGPVTLSVPLAEGSYRLAREIFDDLRCRRPGCARHWRHIPGRARTAKPITFGPPRPRPCQSCPYRKDVRSGLWHRSNYDLLRLYDLPTEQQPTGVFQCHQQGSVSDQAVVCSGWAGCHDGDELLALRMAPVFGTMSVPDVYATRDYVSPVKLFASGAQAAEHGEREIDAPGLEAIALQDKIIRVREMA